MLRIVQLEEIQRILLRVPALVDRLEHRDPGFPEGVKQWLRELEEALKSNRMAVAGDVASLRGLLLAAERGVMPPGMNFLGRYTARKMRDAASATILRQSEEVVSVAIRSDAVRIGDAERVGRQVVALARAKGLIPSVPSEGDRTEYLESAWNKISSEPDLAGGALSLQGMVGPYDALIILDRILEFDQTAGPLSAKSFP